MNIMPNIEAIATQLVNMDTTTRVMVTDPTQAIAEQTVAANTVEANTTAVQTQDEMVGSLLNIKA